MQLEFICRHLRRIQEWLVGRKVDAPRRLESFDVGFHGDYYLMSLVSHCLASVEQFIETGANVGTTLHYVAKMFPAIPAYSCEPSTTAFRVAQERIKNLPNCRFFNVASPEIFEILTRLDTGIFERDTLFWLDAHGYGYEWPLRDEIAIITRRFRRGYLLIDDFKVPEMPCFAYESYAGQECSFDYIRSAINPELRYSLYYPCHRDRTSSHHPLTGWGLIDFGHDIPLALPQELSGKIRMVSPS